MEIQTEVDDPEIAAMRPLNQMAWMMTAATAASSPM